MYGFVPTTKSSKFRRHHVSVTFSRGRVVGISWLFFIHLGLPIPSVLCRFSTWPYPPFAMWAARFRGAFHPDKVLWMADSAVYGNATAGVHRPGGDRGQIGWHRAPPRTDGVKRGGC